MTGARPRLLIVDDHQTLSGPLAGHLTEAGFAVAPPVRAVEEVPAGEAFDLVLCDLKLLGRGGGEAVAYLVGVGHRVLAISGVAPRPVVLAVFAAGARGFVDKSDPPRVLVDAARAVLTEGYFLSPRLAGYLLADADARPLRRGEIGPDETEVLDALARGDNLAEVAEALDVPAAEVGRRLEVVRVAAAARERRYRPSARETDVLRLIGCRGVTQEAAARALGVSANWVTVILTEIRQKYVALHPEVADLRPSAIALLWAHELDLCSEPRS